MAFICCSSITTCKPFTLSNCTMVPADHGMGDGRSSAVNDRPICVCVRNTFMNILCLVLRCSSTAKRSHLWFHALIGAAASVAAIACLARSMFEFFMGSLWVTVLEDDFWLDCHRTLLEYAACTQLHRLVRSLFVHPCSTNHCLHPLPESG